MFPMAPTSSESRSTILALPDELLGEISVTFVLAHADASRYVKSYQWLVISHICRRWRNVAIYTQELWRNIVVNSNEDCVRTMLERSGQQPLTVVCGNDPNYSNIPHATFSTEKAIYAEMHRMQTLELRLAEGKSCQYGCTFAALCAAQAFDAPLLESIALTDFGHSNGVPIFSDPTTLLPKLRHLSIRGGLPSLVSSLIRPSLTSLYLMDSSGDYTLDEVSRILANLQNLQFLILSKVLDPYQSAEDEPSPFDSSLPPPPPSKVVTLPRLQSVQIFDADAGFISALLLYRLRCPSSAIIHIRGYEDSNPDDFQFILQVIAQKGDYSGGILPLDGELHAGTSKSCEISYFKDHHVLSINLTGTCGMRGIHIHCGKYDPNSFIRAFFVCGIPMNGLESLTLRHPWLDDRTWRIILLRTREFKLKRVEVHGDYSTYFLFELLDKVMDYAEKADRGANFNEYLPCTLPDLEELVLVRANWCYHENADLPISTPASENEEPPNSVKGEESDSDEEDMWSPEYMMQFDWYRRATENYRLSDDEEEEDWEGFSEESSEFSDAAVDFLAELDYDDVSYLDREAVGRGDADDDDDGMAVHRYTGGFVLGKSPTDAEALEDRLIRVLRRRLVAESGSWVKGKLTRIRTLRIRDPERLGSKATTLALLRRSGIAAQTLIETSTSSEDVLPRINCRVCDRVDEVNRQEHRDWIM
ncbi:hypothetical protein BC835DRAFT_1397540 [Cytidiella melzeri]|nr:hypothetical protein BC835DRAFT_1397540 [Cytidiella melzeri]